MSELHISSQELSDLTDEAMALAKGYWASIPERRAYPATSGEQTTDLFSRPWAEEGLGRNVLSDFTTIADHSRPSSGRFFGYVVGSGEPVGALESCWRQRSTRMLHRGARLQRQPRSNAS